MKKLNTFGIFLNKISKFTEMLYDQYELATIGRITSTTRNVVATDEIILEDTPVVEETSNGLIKAVSDKTINVGKKLPIEFKIEGKRKNLTLELRNSFFQFIVAKKYKELTKEEFHFWNIPQDDNEVEAYYSAITEYAATKGYDVSFK